MSNIYGSRPSPAKISVKIAQSYRAPLIQSLRNRALHPPNHIESETQTMRDANSQLQSRSLSKRRPRIFDRKYGNSNMKISAEKVDHSNRTGTLHNQSLQGQNKNQQSSKQLVSYQKEVAATTGFDMGYRTRAQNYGEKSPRSFIQGPPTFAKSSSINQEVAGKSIAEMETLLLLSGLPQQFKKMKHEIQNQREQLSLVNNRLHTLGSQSFDRERQLIDSMANKHTQLILKQEELNNNLEKISRIQSQSNERYEKMMKCELELQRAKRIDDLTKQNEKLYQQLLKSKQNETFDTTPLSHYLGSQKVNIVVNNRSFQKQFRDFQNSKQISALSYRRQVDECNDNTIVQLLSPLEIKPDYSF